MAQRQGQLRRNDDMLKRDISAGLLALRSAKGWTRKELAELMTDVTISDLQKWESQVSAPKRLKLVRIARLLALDLSAYPADAVRMAGILHELRQVRTPAPVVDIRGLVAAQRLQSGLSSKDFAASWGVAEQTLRNWEQGNRPTGANIEIVANKLGLPPSAITVV